MRWHGGGRDFPKIKVAVTESPALARVRVVMAKVVDATGSDRFSLPGSQKAKFALRRHAPLSASRYLRRHLYSDFHGVYAGTGHGILYIETQENR